MALTGTGILDASISMFISPRALTLLAFVWGSVTMNVYFNFNF
jgi:hypothetical protein